MDPVYFANADISLVKIYDESLIEQAFNYIVTKAGIEFKYPQGGCQQRAHLMSLILQYKFNIEHCKLWLFSPASLMLNNIQALYIKDANNFTDNHMIEWNYHVVPVVNIKRHVGFETMVIDPSLNSKQLLTLSNFFALIGNSNISKYTFLLPDKYFFNTSKIDGYETNVFDGSFCDFAGQMKNDLTVEKGIALNDVAMKIFHEHIEPFQLKASSNNNQKITDLKAIFGNATALDLLLSQNISGNSENTTVRYALTNYPEIMREARTHFYERLAYWMNFTNNLIQP